jgi:hypothetical protein
LEKVVISAQVGLGEGWTQLLVNDEDKNGKEISVQFQLQLIPQQSRQKLPSPGERTLVDKTPFQLMNRRWVRAYISKDRRLALS